jgi:hypothetical protein
VHDYQSLTILYIICLSIMRGLQSKYLYNNVVLAMTMLI